jgi:shikimate dehydrogenase
MISGSTQIAGVVGDPVGHSFSPIVHNAAFAALGLDWAYVAFPVSASNGLQIVTAMKTMGLRGLSVTTPHKDFVAALADEISSDVALLGAANTLVRLSDDRVRAETTDGLGCVAALAQGGFDVAGKRCVVLGAGAAGRAVILALARSGAASVVVINRNIQRAEAAVELGRQVGVPTSVGDLKAVLQGDLLLNSTSVGLGASVDDPNALLPEVALLQPGQFFYDLTYHPLQTAMMRVAAQRGATVVGGLGMLIHQAALQFKLWTGLEAPIEAMFDAVTAELLRRSSPDSLEA